MSTCAACEGDAREGAMLCDACCAHGVCVDEAGKMRRCTHLGVPCASSREKKEVQPFVTYRISTAAGGWVACEFTDQKQTWNSAVFAYKRGAKKAAHLRRMSLRPAAPKPANLGIVPGASYSEVNAIHTHPPRYVPLSVGGNIVMLSPTPLNERLLAAHVEELETDLNLRDVRIQELEAELKKIRERAKIEIDNRLLTAHHLALEGKVDSAEAADMRGAYFIFFDFLDEAGKEWARNLYGTLEAERDELQKAEAWAKQVVPEPQGKKLEGPTP